LEVHVVHTSSPVGLKLTGEIDASNVHLVRSALLEHRGDGPLHLDLSAVTFCDVGGVRAIVSYAGSRDCDYKLFLHGVPAQMEKLMNVMGWAELTGLEFCGCDLTA
jgi:anti-anti-sigma factor